MAKRSEVAGLIADLEREAAQQRADLVHVDAVLRLYAPELEPDCIPSRAVRRRNGWFQPGELVRMVLDMLRVAPAPLPTREIAAAVMVRHGLDPADMHTARLVGKLVNCEQRPRAPGWRTGRKDHPTPVGDVACTELI
jgi:hypothetical protein